MKILRFFILSILISFILNVVLHEKEQGNFGIIQDSDLTSSESTTILEYPKDYEMSASDICINLKEILIAFGQKSTNLYNTCDYSYQLLGYENTVIQAALPLCFLNLADVFCTYDIVFTKEKLNPNLKEKVLNNLDGCVKSNQKISNDNYFKCPGFNSQKILIEDENKFCSKLERKDVITSGENEEIQVGEEQESVYTFVKKEVNCRFFLNNNLIILHKEKGKCQIMANLFNFCIKGYNLLMPNSNKNECYKQRFAPYSGSYIKRYNEISKKKVLN